MNCPFCTKLSDRSNSEVLYQDERVAVIADGYPLTEGHLLIVPVRHVARLHELNFDEYRALFDEVRVRTGDALKEFTVGVNDGPSAGQTIPHVHVHIVPRSKGDTVDPRGGVRWVVPERAAYYLSAQYRSPAVATAELLRNLRRRYEATSIALWRTAMLALASQVVRDPVLVKVYGTDLESGEPPKVEVHSPLRIIQLEPDRISSEIVAMFISAPDWAITPVSDGQNFWFEAALEQ